MANPARYREIMYEGLWLGQAPTYTPDEVKAMRKDREKKAGQPVGLGPAAPKSQIEQMRELLEQAKRLREEGGE